MPREVRKQTPYDEASRRQSDPWIVHDRQLALIPMFFSWHPGVGYCLVLHPLFRRRGQRLLQDFVLGVGFQATLVHVAGFGVFTGFLMQIA
jgi:membrane protein CcdC involved in cytochrome C biogenesis